MLRLTTRRIHLTIFRIANIESYVGSSLFIEDINYLNEGYNIVRLISKTRLT